MKKLYVATEERSVLFISDKESPDGLRRDAYKWLQKHCNHNQSHSIDIQEISNIDTALLANVTEEIPYGIPEHCPEMRVKDFFEYKEYLRLKEKFEPKQSDNKNPKEDYSSILDDILH